jgi:hypothetical protein
MDIFSQQLVSSARVCKFFSEKKMSIRALQKQTVSAYLLLGIYLHVQVKLLDGNSPLKSTMQLDLPRMFLIFFYIYFIQMHTQ